MNISADKLLEARERDGESAEERPSYVREALSEDIEIGYQQGRPVVAPPEGRPEHVPLGSDVSHLYDHYPRNETILLPAKGDFVRRLLESDKVGGISDAAEELNTDKKTVRKAVELHGIDTPLEPDDGDRGLGDTQLLELELPSGERIPLSLLSDPPHRDKLLLANLLFVGMSVEEIACYLSHETDERVTVNDVRTACNKYNLLSGDGRDENPTDPIPDEKQTMWAGEEGDYATTPW